MTRTLIYTKKERKILRWVAVNCSDYTIVLLCDSFTEQGTCLYETLGERFQFLCLNTIAVYINSFALLEFNQTGNCQRACSVCIFPSFSYSSHVIVNTGWMHHL